MTDEQIFKHAILCGLEEVLNESLLKFARAIYYKGREYQFEYDRGISPLSKNGETMRMQND